MFKEDMTQFFNTGDFAVQATCNGRTVNVLFEKPESIIAGGEVVSAEYVIIYKAGDLPDLKADDSISIECEGNFKVNEPTRIQDGKVFRTTLRKV